MGKVGATTGTWLGRRTSLASHQRPCTTSSSVCVSVFDFVLTFTTGLRPRFLRFSIWTTVVVIMMTLVMAISSSPSSAGAPIGCMLLRFVSVRSWVRSPEGAQLLSGQWQDMSARYCCSENGRATPQSAPSLTRAHGVHPSNAASHRQMTTGLRASQPMPNHEYTCALGPGTRAVVSASRPA